MRFLAEGEKVGKGVRSFGDVAQEGGGVVEGGILHAVLREPMPMFSRDAEILFDQPHGGDPAETDDDFRLQQGKLLV